MNWADTWQLRHNKGKHEILLLDNKTRKFDFDMKRHGCENRADLQKAEMGKNLGANVDYEVKFSRQVEIQENNTNKDTRSQKAFV